VHRNTGRAVTEWFEEPDLLPQRVPRAITLLGSVLYSPGIGTFLCGEPGLYKPFGLRNAYGGLAVVVTVRDSL